jgi:hypothetical protein
LALASSRERVRAAPRIRTSNCRPTDPQGRKHFCEAARLWIVSMILFLVNISQIIDQDPANVCLSDTSL